MSATGLLGHHKLPVLFVVVCLLSLSAAVSRAWGQAPEIQNTVYTYGQPNTMAPAHTPHGIKIPGHLVDQAMRHHWQQVAYQPQLVNHAATGQPGTAAMQNLFIPSPNMLWAQATPVTTEVIALASRSLSLGWHRSTTDHDAALR